MVSAGRIREGREGREGREATRKPPGRPGRPCGSLAGRLRVACGSLRVASRRREGPPRPDRGAPPGRNREGRPGSSLSKREGGEPTREARILQPSR